MALLFHLRLFVPFFLALDLLLTVFATHCLHLLTIFFTDIINVKKLFATRYSSFVLLLPPHSTQFNKDKIEDINL